jgi:hypothetical protein
MSLAINLGAVRRVLLADGWHEIVPGSLNLDAYEMHHGDESVEDWPGAWPLRGGSVAEVSSTGFGFDRAGSTVRVYGPITSLLAVETVAREQETA